MVKFYTTVTKRQHPMMEPVMAYNHNPPKGWFKTYNYCVRCRQTYPKETIFCPDCRTQVRTRSRRDARKKKWVKRY